MRFDVVVVDRPAEMKYSCVSGCIVYICFFYTHNGLPHKQWLHKWADGRMALMQANRFGCHAYIIFGAEAQKGMWQYSYFLTPF